MSSTVKYKPPLELAICPDCGNSMHLFWSLRKKVCSVCEVTYDWDLKEGKQPLIKHQR